VRQTDAAELIAIEVFNASRAAGATGHASKGTKAPAKVTKGPRLLVFAPGDGWERID
jgi:hypothetical protein